MNSEKNIRSYDRKARRYEQRWKAYLKHTHEKFLNRIFTSPGETILDASGGTGLLAQELISSQFPFDRLILNEPSGEMLKVAKARLKGESRISFTRHLAHDLPFKEPQFDTILCLNSFHLYPEQNLVLERFYHILKPGGRLYLLDWNRSGFFRMVNRIIKWSVSEFINTRSPAEIIRMTTEAGFSIESSESWTWRYWKFLFLELKKLNTEKNN